jgi:hypothetical protein
VEAAPAFRPEFPWASLPGPIVPAKGPEPGVAAGGAGAGRYREDGEVKNRTLVGRHLRDETLVLYDIQPTLFDETDMAEITSPDYPGERLIACYNPFLAAERDRERGAAFDLLGLSSA